MKSLSTSFHNTLLLALTQETIDKSLCNQLLEEMQEKELFGPCIHIAYTHALIPQLYRAIRECTINKSSYQRLCDIHHAILLENIKLSAELKALAKIFQDEEIAYLSVKGPLLSYQLYQDLTMRQICDLDILVDKSELLAVAKLLLERGYRSDLPLTLLENSGFIALDNDFTFLHHQKKIMVELHWKLFPTRHKMHLDFTTLYQAHQELPIQGQMVPTLSDMHNLLYLSLHASKHIFEQLKWVCDIDRLVRKVPINTVLQAYELSKELQVKEPFLLALLMAQRLYSTPLPPEASSWKSSRSDKLLQKSLHYFREDFTLKEEPIKKRLRFLFLQELNQEKQHPMLSILLSFFRPSSVDYIYYQLPEQLNFLYPLLRPPRLIYKYILKKIHL